jgi:hypothetical protein
MRKVYTLLALVFAMSLVGAASTEPATVYDVIDMNANNFQGDITAIAELGEYSWGFELGYVNSNDYADKNKKVTGILGLKFVPVNEDGSYCQTHHPCSWEEHDILIETDTETYRAYLPAGDIYNTPLWFYVAQDGSTYWAKSGHAETHVSVIDLDFEDAAVPEHLARKAPTFVEEQVSDVSCVFYYWFDDNTQDCGHKDFCGVYIYQGLQTFDSLVECNAALTTYLIEDADSDGKEDSNAPAIVYIVIGLIILVVLYYAIDRMRKSLPTGVKRKSSTSKRRKVTKQKPKKTAKN